MVFTGKEEPRVDEARAPNRSCYSPRVADVAQWFYVLRFAPHPHPRLQEGLWTASKKVSPEDVEHMQNRVEHFRFNHVFRQGDLQEVQNPDIANVFVLFLSWFLGLVFLRHHR
jgi:hypothetical protein